MGETAPDEEENLMSTLNERIALIPSGNIMGKSGAKLTVSGTTQAGSEIVGSMVDVQTDTDEVFISFGSSPTAAADTGYRLFSGAVFRFNITPGSKLAGIIGSGTANVWYHAVG
jgi:hypothetical protein